MTILIFSELSDILRCPIDGGELSPLGSLISCGKCGNGFTFKDGKVFFVEPPKDVVEHLNKFSPQDPGQWTNWRRSNFNFLKDYLVQEDKNKILVDIGTGEAQFLDLISEFKKIVAVDFYPYRHVNVVADVVSLSLPLKDNSCDIVIMSNVLEHIPEPKRLLNECNRILKKAGMVVGTVPFMAKVHQAPYDFYRYTNFMLKRLLLEAGFCEVKVKSLGSPFNVYSSAQNVFFSLFVYRKFSTNRAVDLILKFVVWLARFCILLPHWGFKPLLKNTPPSDIFTEGWGFIARKK